jgi:hypothetical protein
MVWISGWCTCGGSATAKVSTVPPRTSSIGVAWKVENPPVDLLKSGERVKLYNPKRAGTQREWGVISPSMVFPYRSLDGVLLGYVLRHELTDGKETPMVMRVRLPGGQECWSRYPFPKPRPLYGLPVLRDKRQAIVVEGEKCRDLLYWATGRAVVSWPGGTQGVKHCDWSPLAGLDVVVWPDFDKPGKHALDEIGVILTGAGCRVRVAGADGI